MKFIQIIMWITSFVCFYLLKELSLEHSNIKYNRNGYTTIRENTLLFPYIDIHT